MAFTEASLLSDMTGGSTNATVKIIGFIVGSSVTDVYIQNDDDTCRRTGPWVQVPNSYTAAQAHTLIDNVMGGLA